LYRFYKIANNHYRFLADECLQQQSFLQSLDQPTHHDLDFLKEWLEQPSGGNFTLEGIDKDVWHTGRDLLTLATPSEKDLFSRWITGEFVDILHRWRCWSKKRSPDLENGVTSYDSKKLLRFADILGMILSCLIPIVSVVILYLVPNLLVRLGLIAVFMICFCLTLAMTTEARRVEIFAAAVA